MKQSLIASWFETIASTATGFLISLGLQYIVCWWYDLPLRLQDNLAIIALFTVASLLRGIGWRRLMEALHVRRPLSAGMQAVIAERFRQIEDEGFDAKHDDQHAPEELAAAGAAYLLSAGTGKKNSPPICWRWHKRFWNPKDTRRDMVRGLALGLAGLDLFDRSYKPQSHKPTKAAA